MIEQIVGLKFGSIYNNDSKKSIWLTYIDVKFSFID